MLRNVLKRILLLFIVALFVTSFTEHKGKHYTLATVVIDAGHGGHDSGCLGKKTKEKDVSLAVALKLGKYIENNFKDVKVIYTRKTDVFLELHERVAIANNAKADLFICIHCNSAAAHEVFGPETWVMGLHMTKANLEVSKRENDVVLLEKDYMNKYDGFDPNSPEANIIFSLYQNTYLDQSLRMASLVQQEFTGKGRNGRGVKQAGFLVLYKTSMPSILVETGFLTNVNEEKYLASVKGQDEIAHSIFNAFRSYKNSVESPPEENQLTMPPLPHEDEEYKAPEECCDQQIKPIKPFDDHSSMDSLNKNKSLSTPVKESGIVTGNNPVKKKNNDNKTEKKDVVVFSVQFLLSSKSLPKDSPKFKGVKEVSEEMVDGQYKYKAGSFSSMDDAMRHQSELRKKGFADAFVVAYKNGKRIAIKEAR